MNGNPSPFVGTIPETTIKFIIVCSVIKIMNPRVVKNAKASLSWATIF